MPAISIPGEAWGLIGVAVGWVLNAITDAIRRRARREDRTRELELQRGETLVEHCHESFMWMEEARRVAFNGDVYIPVQTSVFQAAAIVEIYYQALRHRMQQLDTAATEYRGLLIQITTNRHQGLSMTDELTRQLVAIGERLMTSIGLLLADARDAVRAKAY